MIEENDLVVQKKAICITKELLSYINSNNLCISSMPDQVKELLTANDLGNFETGINKGIVCGKDLERKRARLVDSSIHVIDILSASKDYELLPDLRNHGRTQIYPKDWAFAWQYANYITVKEFWLHTSTYNFNECNAKTEWVKFTRSGLDSMLNDIIGYSTNCFVDGADLLDCY